MSNCQSIRINDEYHCRFCSLRWDVKDPEPPSCGYSGLDAATSVVPTPSNNVPNSYLAAKNGE